MEAPYYPDRVRAPRRYGYTFEVNKDGYIRLRIGKRWVMEHRYVKERELGRSLEDWEDVHHKNSNRQDNSPDNLEVLTKSEHTKHHWIIGGKAHFGH
jgi:hypothetical protein